MSIPPPQRLPSSLYESPAYDPSWRYLQVEEYLRCRRRAVESDETFVIPTTERDSMVRAYFKFRIDAPTPKAAVCRYAQDCDDTNTRNHMASRLKAMAVAGFTSEQIAERLHSSPENIEAYLQLFFDVEAYVADRAALGAILAPLIQESTNTLPRERIWLVAALKLGPKGLDYVMDQRVKLSAEEQREISESIHGILAEQTLAYSLSLQAKAEVSPETMDAYHRSLEMRMRNPDTTDTSKRDIFRQSITQMVLRMGEERRAAGKL